MRQAISQDEFVKLINEHQALLYKVCNFYGHTEHDRQDLFQEIIIQSWKSYPKFRADAKFSTWLYRIALNTAISDIRKQKTKLVHVEPGQLPTEIEDIQYTKDRDERLQLLYIAINQLSQIEKAVVMLYLEDKSYEEIEDILGINQNNLRVKMNRIKEKLRKLTNAVEYGT